MFSEDYSSVPLRSSFLLRAFFVRLADVESRYNLDSDSTGSYHHRSHLNITPILPYTASNPTVLESLVYWTRSAVGSEQGYKVNIKDVSGSQAPFDEKSGLARNGSVKKQSKGGVSLGAESDVSFVSA